MKPATGKMRFIPGSLGVLFICGMALLFAPLSTESGSFVSVTSPDAHDLISGNTLSGRPHGDFVIHEGQLYLKTQVTRSALILVTWVRRYDWSSAKLKEFRADHPELEGYYPDPTKPNAGITWIQRGKD